MSDQPIHVFAKWTAKEGYLPAVLEHVQTVATRSRAEEGNLFYNVFKSTSEVNTLFLYEGYANEHAALEHRNTAHFQQLVLGEIVPLLAEREVTVTHSMVL